jgi:hypothetical protein
MFHCHVNDHITGGMTGRYEVKAKVAIDLIRSVAVETAAGSMRDLRVAEVTKMERRTLVQVRGLLRLQQSSRLLSASVPHDEPTVDVDGLARHVVRVATSEEAHEAGESSAVSGRPSGISEVRRFQASPVCQPSITLHSASTFLHIGVSTTPGQIQFEVIRYAASTCAAVRVMLTTPALLAA